MQFALAEIAGIAQRPQVIVAVQTGFVYSPLPHFQRENMVNMQIHCRAAQYASASITL
jgi:hypothetical protein